MKNTQLLAWHSWYSNNS